MTGAVSAGSNLATLDAETRMHIEADKFACMLMRQQRGMTPLEYDRHWKAQVKKLKPDMQKMVINRLKERSRDQQQSQGRQGRAGVRSDVRRPYRGQRP